MKNIHLPVQIQPIWLSGNQHNFLVSDLTAIRRLNIIIAHAQWILKASLAPHFALLLSERNNTWQVWNTCLLSMHSTVYKGTTWVYLFKRAQWNILHSICVWDITKVLRHQYFRGLFTSPISKYLRHYGSFTTPIF